MAEKELHDDVTTIEEVDTFADVAPMEPGLEAVLSTLTKGDFVAQGGQAQVHHVKKGDLDLAARSVSIIDEEVQIKRLQREARIVRGLDHPNIVRYRGYEVNPVKKRWGTDVEYTFYMDWIDGPTLRDILENGEFHRELSGSETDAIFAQIGSALSYGHDRGIFHRDIKPSNIKLKEGDVVKVIDYGLVKKEGETTITESAGRFDFTFKYAAPEVRNGKPATAASDWYSAAVTAVELLEGKPYTKVVDPADVREKLSKKTFLPPRLKQSLELLLEEDPVVRMGNVETVKRLYGLGRVETVQEVVTASLEEGLDDDSAAFEARNAGIDWPTVKRSGEQLAAAERSYWKKVKKRMNIGMTLSLGGILTNIPSLIYNLSNGNRTLEIINGVGILLGGYGLYKGNKNRKIAVKELERLDTNVKDLEAHVAGSDEDTVGSNEENRTGVFYKTEHGIMASSYAFIGLCFGGLFSGPIGLALGVATGAVRFGTGYLQDKYGSVRKGIDSLIELGKEKYRAGKKARVLKKSPASLSSTLEKICEGETISERQMRNTVLPALEHRDNNVRAAAIKALVKYDLERREYNTLVEQALPLLYDVKDPYAKVDALIYLTAPEATAEEREKYIPQLKKVPSIAVYDRVKKFYSQSASVESLLHFYSIFTERVEAAARKPSDSLEEKVGESEQSVLIDASVAENPTTEVSDQFNQEVSKKKIWTNCYTDVGGVAAGSVGSILMQYFMDSGYSVSQTLASMAIGGVVGRVAGRLYHKYVQVPQLRKKYGLEEKVGESDAEKLVADLSDEDKEDKKGLVERMSEKYNHWRERKGREWFEKNSDVYKFNEIADDYSKNGISSKGIKRRILPALHYWDSHVQKKALEVIVNNDGKKQEFREEVERVFPKLGYYLNSDEYCRVLTYLSICPHNGKREKVTRKYLLPALTHRNSDVQKHALGLLTVLEPEAEVKYKAEISKTRESMSKDDDDWPDNPWHMVNPLKNPK